MRLLIKALVFWSALVASTGMVFAHPHVFIEANLEVFRDKDGRATELRHVWRFDPIFSTSVIIDFDQNGDNALSVEELDDVAKTVKENLNEFQYYTQVKLGDEDIEFEVPKIFLANYDDGQLTLIVAMDLKKPQEISGKKFSVSVSDPTYYVAVEFMDEKAIEVSGSGVSCKHEIERPNFDELYSQSPEVFAKDFLGSDDPEVFNSDDYLTWVHFNCG